MNNMDFSSLVLIEKDKETGNIKKELGSFRVNEGAVFVKKLFAIDNEVNLYFDTNKDVEEWEYSGIYDLFNSEVFRENGFIIEEDLEEFNPTFVLKFQYKEEHLEMRDVINKAVDLIKVEIENAFKAIEGKENEYKEN
jgi:hypothetical protein